MVSGGKAESDYWPGSVGIGNMEVTGDLDKGSLIGQWAESRLQVECEVS